MMVNLWLVIGGVLIVGVMAAAMFLPRPNAEYAVSELPFRFGSPDQKSLRYATGREGVKRDRPEARAERSEGEPPKSATSNQADKSPFERPGKKPSPDGSTRAEGKGDDSRNPPKRDESPENQGENAAQRKSAETQPGRTARDKPSEANRPERGRDSSPRSPDTSAAQIRQQGQFGPTAEQ